MVLVASFQEGADRERSDRSVRIRDQDIQLTLAHGDESGLFARDFVDHAQCGKLVNRLALVLGKLNEDLKGTFHIDSRSKNVKKFAHRLRRLKLYHILVLDQRRLNIRHKCLRSFLVMGRVLDQRLFDVANQLALRDGSPDLPLRELVQKFEATHGI